LLRAFLAAAVALMAPVFAHEQRQVGGFQLTVGWQHEPTYAGVENAVQIFIKDSKGKPVNDLGDPPSLKVQVITGSQTSDPLDLKASFDPDSGEGTPGEFDATLIPTAPGDYTFHLTGSINGQNIDEKFTSSDKTFDPVKDPNEVEFPAKTPSPGQMAQSIDRLGPRVDTASKSAKSAKNDASNASTLGIIGIVVGSLGLIVGGVGLSRSRR
jgi:hypothetical protein